MAKDVYFILDLDRVLFDTERLYKSRETQGEEDFFPFVEDEGALEELEKLGTVCIFSEVTVNGSLELQITKVQKLGLHKRIPSERIHIGENKMLKFKKLLERYRGLVILVDDKIDNLEKAEKIKREGKVEVDLFTVWVQRGMHAEKAEKEGYTFKPDVIVLNLRELIPIAKSIVKTKVITN